MDATTYMTGDLPDYIANSPLFCYKIHPGNTGIIKMSSWFIVAKRNHELIVRTQQMLEDYWERHNHLCHYFLFHISKRRTLLHFPAWRAIGVPFLTSTPPSRTPCSLNCRSLTPRSAGNKSKHSRPSTSLLGKSALNTSPARALSSNGY